MTNLTNQLPENTYGDLITCTNGGQGLPPIALSAIQDGFGNNSPLSMSQIQINISRSGSNTFSLDGINLIAQAAIINQVCMDDPVLPGHGSVTVPIGTTAQRPSTPVNGMIRYNTDMASLETYENNVWTPSSGSGTVTFVNISTSSTGVTVGGGPITTAGTLTVDIGLELQGLSLLAANGLVTRLGAGSYTERTLGVGSANLTITNGNGVAGSPTYDLNTTLTGLVSIAVGNLGFSGNTIQSTNLNGVINLSPAGTGAVKLINATNAVPLQFWNAAATHFVALRAGVLGADVTWTLPTTDSTGVQALVSNGAGILSWVNLLDVDWIDQTSTPVTIVPNTSYVADTAGLLTFNMPASVTQFAEIQVQGNGAGGWLIQLAGGQTAHWNSGTTSVAGSIASTNRYNGVTLLCTVANTTFVVIENEGAITLA